MIPETARTWKVVTKQERASEIPPKLPFKRKRDTDGDFVQHSVLLVAKGNAQGKDSQTVAPTIDFTTVHTSFAITVKRTYLTDQLDVKTASLHGDVKEEIYIKEPDGFKICK